MAGKLDAINDPRAGRVIPGSRSGSLLPPSDQELAGNG